MVDVSEKKPTDRFARASGRIKVGRAIIQEIKNNELVLAKGPVFQTAILAGVMGAKKTSEVIPFCHPVSLEDCGIHIHHDKQYIYLESHVRMSGKTGVEMEALTAVSIAALTVYDMCKAMSHDIVIEEIRLEEKRGGKKDFKRTAR